MKTYPSVLEFWFNPDHTPYWFEKVLLLMKKSVMNFMTFGNLFLSPSVCIGVHLFMLV